jgi:HSP20 family protein
MASDRGQQQREGNQPQATSRSSGTTGAADRTETRDQIRDETRATGADQERQIQTGREGTSSTGVSRRSQSSPLYGSGAGRVSPLMVMRRMAEDMDRLFENFGLGTSGLSLSPAFGTGLSDDLWGGTSTALERAAWTPPIEAFRRGDNLVVRADLPGLRKEDVNVEIDNGMLTISGQRQEQHEEDRDGFYRSERSYGQFYRALPLPEGVTGEQCDATFKDGVLEVTLPVPKEQGRKAKQVPIR